ncbi:Double-stranded RNA-binding protein 4 [Carex littledalei]|uniref:Double-stranded RNA-binding protein 4 n=1 Tax=Carex littledalei TaxID=544730 RepID=A0A833RDZ9_9POAL|nr:Double-stranded RNA-binding protein 4 [Carex littledalei]
MYVFKDKLISYARAHGFDKPNYHLKCQGAPHAPCFRATVDVAGHTFTSPETFNRRKDAEHFISKLAFQSLSHQQVAVAPANVIANNACKSILKEYCDKKGCQDLPLYKTDTHESGPVQKFVSSVTIQGNMYCGPPSKSKKEAEQAAARVAIDSILGTKMNF